MTYPSDPFGPRDPKINNATRGKTRPRDCLVPRRLSLDANLRAMDSGKEKAELTFWPRLFESWIALSIG